jgi:ATP-dependent protease ClpP protease subunit
MKQNYKQYSYSKNIKPKFEEYDDEEEQENQCFARKQLSFFKKQQVSTCLVIPIDQPIMEPSYYRNVVQAIQNTSANDVIEFHIVSPGGSLSGLQTLLSAIWSTDAETVAHINGECSSAASMLAMHCSNLYVSPMATMLIHGVSYSTGYSKNPDIKNLVDHITDYSESLFRDTYKHFLTEEETVKCLNGFQLYLNAEEIGKRLEHKFEMLRKEHEAQQAEEAEDESEDDSEETEQDYDYEYEDEEESQDSNN